MIDIEEAESVSLSGEEILDEEEGESDIARVKSIQNKFSNAIAWLEYRIDKLEETIEKLEKGKRGPPEFGEVIYYFFMVWIAIYIGSVILFAYIGHPVIHWHDGDSIFTLVPKD